MSRQITLHRPVQLLWRREGGPALVLRHEGVRALVLAAGLLTVLTGQSLAAQPPTADLVRDAAKRFAEELTQRTDLVRVAAEEGSVDLDRLRRDAADYRWYLEWLRGQQVLIAEEERSALDPTLDSLEPLVWNLERAATGRRLPESLPADLTGQDIGVPSGPDGLHRAPSNDSCDHAAIVSTGTYNGTTTGATNDGAARCGSSYLSPDVWLSLTPTTTDTYSIETFGTSFDAVLSLHSGCPGTINNEITCNDDYNGTSAFLLANLTSGRTYLIRVAGFGGATGNFRVYISQGGSKITGRVTESAGGAPVSHGQVSAFDTEGMQVGSGSISSNGTYTVRNLAAGTYYLTAPSSGAYDWVPEVWLNHPCPGGTCDPTTGDTVTTSLGGTVSNVNFAVQRTAILTGTIRDEETGLPLQSARAWLYDGEGNSVGSGYTDSSGAFEIDRIGAGTYYLMAGHDLYRWELHDDVPCPHGSSTGCDPTTGTPISLTFDQVRTVDFDLTQKGALSGSLTSAADGAPIYGAQVTVYRDNGTVAKTVATDSGGNWWAGGLDPGSYFAKASASAFTPQLYLGYDCSSSCDPVISGTGITIGEGQQLGGVDFDLAPHGRIAGFVTDAATGDAVSGDVSVRFHTEDQDLVAWAWTTSGSYLSPTLQPGRYLVRTVSTGYRDELFDDLPCEGSCNLDAGTRVVVSSGATSTADLDLVAAGKIAGMVTLEDTGEPLRVGVVVWGLDGQEITSGSSSLTGAYELGGLDPGTYFVTTRLSTTALGELYDDIPCWRGAPDSCTPTDGTPVIVTDGATSHANFVLQRAGRLSGNVTDASTGNPLGTSVHILSTTSTFQRSTSSTSWNGSFAFEFLAPDSYLIVADAANHADTTYPNAICAGEFPEACDPSTGSPVSIGIGADVQGIDIALPPLGQISGVVRRAADGQPCAYCYVRAWTGDVEQRYTSTSSSGTYTLIGLWPGTYTVSAGANSNAGLLNQIFENINCADPISATAEPGCRPSDGTPIPLGFGEHLDGIDLALVARSTITGTLWNADTGGPVSPRQVQLWHADSGITSTQVDAVGRFELTGLGPGTYYLVSRRSSGSGTDFRLMDMLYEDLPCFGGPFDGGCNPKKGTPIVVQAGQTLRGIDLHLPTVPTGVAGMVVAELTGEALEGVAIDVWVAATGTHVSRVYSSAAGSWYAEVEPGTYVLSSANHLGYTDQVWGGPECSNDGACDPTLGARVVVGTDGPVGGIQFRLRDQPLFTDGFESGSSGAWSSSTP